MFSVYYFNIFHQSDLATLIHNTDLYSTAAHLPMSPLHYMYVCSCVWCMTDDWGQGHAALGPVLWQGPGQDC